MSRRAAFALAGLVVLAVAVRLLAATYTHATLARAEENRTIARNLAAGRGYAYTAFGVTGPTAVRTPAYPMLLALLGPDRVGRSVVLNSLLGGASVVAAFCLARRLAVPRWVTDDKGRLRPGDESSTPGRPPRAAWLAAACFAVWPTQVYAATLTQGLSLAVLLTLSAATLALRGRSRERPRSRHAIPGSGPTDAAARAANSSGTPEESTARAVASRRPVRSSDATPALVGTGLLAGLAVLTEPVLVLPLLLVFVALLRRSDLAVALLAAGVLVLPWAYRNAVAVGGTVGLTSTLWQNAFLGNAPGGTGPIDMSKDRIGRLPPPEYDRLKVPEADRAAVLRGWFLAGVTRAPLDYAAACLGRGVSLLFGTIDHPLAASPLYLVSRSVAACGFFVLPLLAGRSDGRWVLVCGTLTLGLLLATVFTRTEARLAVLTDVPQLLALAGAAGRRGATA